MFGTMQRGVNAYAKVGLETNVSSASPHALIVMLYDGALVAVLKAIAHMKAGNIAEKGKAVSHAIAIIDNGLRASLDINGQRHDLELDTRTTLLDALREHLHLIYLASAVVLNAGFLYYAWKMYRHYTDLIARKRHQKTIMLLQRAGIPRVNL